MFSYHCLNPIAEVGLDQFSTDYKKVEAAETANAILVRSAAMHDMEVWQQFAGNRKSGCRCQQHSAGALRQGRYRRI